jgi:hypothetical protein
MKKYNEMEMMMRQQMMMNGGVNESGMMLNGSMMNGMNASMMNGMNNQGINMNGSMMNTRRGSMNMGAGVMGMNQMNPPNGNANGGQKLTPQIINQMMNNQVKKDQQMLRQMMANPQANKQAVLATKQKMMNRNKMMFEKLKQKMQAQNQNPQNKPKRFTNNPPPNNNNNPSASGDKMGFSSFNPKNKRKSLNAPKNRNQPQRNQNIPQNKPQKPQNDQKPRRRSVNQNLEKKFNKEAQKPKGASRPKIPKPLPEQNPVDFDDNLFNYQTKNNSETVSNQQEPEIEVFDVHDIQLEEKKLNLFESDHGQDEAGDGYFGDGGDGGQQGGEFVEEEFDFYGRPVDNGYNEQFNQTPFYG